MVQMYSSWCPHLRLRVGRRELCQEPREYGWLVIGMFMSMLKRQGSFECARREWRVNPAKKKKKKKEKKASYLGKYRLIHPRSRKKVYVPWNLSSEVNSAQKDH